MAFTFNATQGDPGQNSYVSEIEASDYFDGDPRAEVWGGLAVLEQQQYLVAATNRLDIEEYGGEVDTATQPLQWPRENVNNRNYDYYDNTTTPRAMKHATYELASWLLDQVNEEALVSRGDQDRMVSYTVGPLSVVLRKVKENELPDVVTRILRSIGSNGWLGGNGLKLVR